MVRTAEVRTENRVSDREPAEVRTPRYAARYARKLGSGISPNAYRIRLTRWLPRARLPLRLPRKTLVSTDRVSTLFPRETGFLAGARHRNRCAVTAGVTAKPRYARWRYAVRYAWKSRFPGHFRKAAIPAIGVICDRGGAQSKLVSCRFRFSSARAHAQSLGRRAFARMMLALRVDPPPRARSSCKDCARRQSRTERMVALVGVPVAHRSDHERGRVQCQQSPPHDRRRCIPPHACCTIVNARRQCITSRNRARRQRWRENENASLCE
jgi:hypothetical protein